MKMSIRSVLTAAGLAAGISASGAGAAWGHGDEFTAGEPGDPKKPARIVQVLMRDGDGKMVFIPDRLELRKGEQVRFLLRNIGELDHEFLLATEAENLKHAEEMKKNPDMEHDEPNGKRVRAKGAAELVWRFTKAGVFEYGCLIPGHREGGMIGRITVK